MRLNKYIANTSTLSRRKADSAISEGRVKVDGKLATPGLDVSSDNSVELDGVALSNLNEPSITLLLNKPTGYVCSRDGQGSPIIYKLIPSKYRGLNIAGRLDKDSSGLVILTNDGTLLQQLTHPSFLKKKHYIAALDKPISRQHLEQLIAGVDIGDERLSKFLHISKISSLNYALDLGEGRNRQIRRTFDKLHYQVLSLHRTSIDKYKLGSIPLGKHKIAE